MGMFEIALAVAVPIALLAQGSLTAEAAQKTQKCQVQKAALWAWG